MRTIGVDTGGTFTDLVLRRDEETVVVKLPSTPDDPARAVLEGLARLGGVGGGDHVVHGTTVALNALLTGSTAPAALVTGTGFADLIEIGRQERPDIYDLEPRKVRPLVPRELRFEIPQRIWPASDGDGFETVREPRAAELVQLRRRIRASAAESIAVCLLHSWADPSIEERVAAALEPLGLPITTSAGLLPEHREYERFSTAAVNAVLAPLMRAYLGPLEARLAGARLSILQSSGGTLPAARAALEPARVILSGPAGGVVGAARAAREAGLGRIVALDMGGTSTDVALHDAGPDCGPDTGSADDAGAAARMVEPMRIAGYPVGVPSLDIHTIGCGGGSLVRVDAGGVLHVGPESAGADPGPVCYGHSDVPTVTDAHVQLGHIASGPFLSGDLVLDVEGVRRAFERTAKRLGATPREVARGVLDVARASMRRAIGVMTMQRGQDPALLPLVAFGGAGGLHAAALAASLDMPAALVPRHPGALSAWGMGAADAVRELAVAPLEPLERWGARRRRDTLNQLSREGRRQLVEAGHAARSIKTTHHLDLRYAGQSFEIRMPHGKDPAEAFHAAHQRLYGYRLPERSIELVCLRAEARVAAPAATGRRPRFRPLPASAVRGERSVVFERAVRARVVARDALVPGHAFDGPAVVDEYSGTTLVPPGWRARVTAGSHLLLERPGSRS